MRYCRSVIAAVAILVIASAAQSGPVVVQPLQKFPNVNQYDFVQYAPFQMLQGWESNRNQNYDYIPVETVVVLQRNYPMLPASTVITNEPTLLNLEGKGLLAEIRSSQIINGTMVPDTVW